TAPSPMADGAEPVRPATPSKPGAGKARRVYDAPDKGVLWGWEVSGYIWTKAMAAGLFLVPFLLSMAEPASAGMWSGFMAAALVFLGLTGALLVKDLDQPARFAYVLLRPQWRSWLVRGAYIITAYGGLLTLGLVLALQRWLSAGSGAAASRNLLSGGGWPAALILMLGTLTALTAACTAVYTAFLFAQAKGRDLWQSPLAALQMLVHSPLAGSAGLALFSPWLDLPESWIPLLGWLLGGSLTVHLGLLALELGTPHATGDAHRAASFILRGRLARAFWGGAVMLGGLLPLALLLLGTALPAAPDREWIALTGILPLAGLAALVGLYFSEHVWVRAPQWIRLS
ncbi:MAG TPA: NrfD/PsrC family molybdoenzyme membrane anchor subunit, partial [Acidobacteriota bacterium]|nr:NrfD/PsrC family molybdoenzyme membrane anchor subunit [Acidobacteriota bacterium]